MPKNHGVPAILKLCLQLDGPNSWSGTTLSASTHMDPTRGTDNACHVGLTVQVPLGSDPVIPSARPIFLASPRLLSHPMNLICYRPTPTNGDFLATTAQQRYFPPIASMAYRRAYRPLSSSLTCDYGCVAAFTTCPPSLPPSTSYLPPTWPHA
jgi:hypothetical protein